MAIGAARYAINGRLREISAETRLARPVPVPRRGGWVDTAETVAGAVDGCRLDLPMSR
jgi:hypothetical protein